MLPSPAAQRCRAADGSLGQSINGDPRLPGVARVDTALAEKLEAAAAESGQRSGARVTAGDEAHASPTYTNRLILESSPYLLQHAHNPVNWYPWGDEAFARAKREAKPVLLSIGYSTCHWCHVMERESFEDVEIARYLNEHFVAVKVDREERPDIDSVYMRAVQLLTGSGGWPMTLILTPERRPFFAATYIPARDGDRGARKGFLSVLRELSDAYATSPEEVLAHAERLSLRLAAETSERSSETVPGAAAIVAAVDLMKRTFDAAAGGFGRAPKFPHPSMFELLLHYHRRTSDAQALAMVTRSLERMARGGIFDQIGGGFHRYATDADWLVPHFEKMLYDNAELASLYLDAYQATGRTDFADVARRTLDYLAREMSSPEGAFYAATDADSQTPQGNTQEGWYFTWTPAEIDVAAGSELAAATKAYFGVTEAGDIERRSVLNAARSPADVASSRATTPERLLADIETARARLYTARLHRTPPFRDEKIVAAWNGLAVSAFARAAFVLDSTQYADQARRTAGFVLDGMRNDAGQLARSVRGKHRGQAATLDDYAFVVQGLLDLYEAVWESRWLGAALELQSRLDDAYFDDERGDYFLTAHDSERLLTRPVSREDGAEPAGNSVAALNLLRLAELTGNDAYRRRAEYVLRSFADVMLERPLALPQMLCALDYYLDQPLEIVIVSAADDTHGLGALLARARKAYLPNRMLAVTASDREASERRALVPLVENKSAMDGRTTAYVCRKRVCDLPTSDPDRFSSELSRVEPLFDGHGALQLR